MNKLLLSLALFIGTNGVFTSVYAQSCKPENEGKFSCIEGETMKCVKKFDPITKNIIYEIEAVTVSGQTVNVDSPLYKKTLGYSPKPCAATK